MKLNINGKQLEINSDELKSALESEEQSFEIQSDFVLRSKDEEETYSSKETDTQDLDNEEESDEEESDEWI